MRGRSAKRLFAIAAVVVGVLLIGASSASASIVNGVVKDGSGGGWTLYARLHITGPEFDATIYNDPLTGYYSIDLPDGATYHFTVVSQIPGYNPGIADVDVNVAATDDPPGIVQNFDLGADASVCTAPGYEQGGTQGPNVIWSESFNGGVLPPGWEAINNSGNGVGWLIQTDWAPCFEQTGNTTGGVGAFALVNSDCDGFVDLDEELRTSTIDFDGYAGAISDVQAGLRQPGRHRGRGRERRRRRDVDQRPAQTTDHVGPNTTTIPLVGVGGAAAKIRFHYYNAFFAWWWAVDDLVVNDARPVHSDRLRRRIGDRDRDR